ncbi:MAG: hypothetical protein ACOC56_00265, partial [Atribacterota bacterium]
TIHHKSNKNNIKCFRQIPINGFGIADMVSISWSSSRKYKSFSTINNFINNQKLVLRAFEIKLNNWRKGMTQAHRYRYFANVAILVLPFYKKSIALKHIDTFKKIRVGLWSFDIESKRIISHYTPRPSEPIELRQFKKAIQIINNTSKVLPVARNK